ncbi:MAG: hypothetical protein LBM92_03320 [Opitutaceae bacterium]|jgi:hypothetical protein|nr:hypothetical protein [Opitutaceae bacterium]
MSTVAVRKTKKPAVHHALTARQKKPSKYAFGPMIRKHIGTVNTGERDLSTREGFSG